MHPFKKATRLVSPKPTNNPRDSYQVTPAARNARAPLRPVDALATAYLEALNQPVPYRPRATMGPRLHDAIEQWVYAQAMRQALGRYAWNLNRPSIPQQLQESVKRIAAEASAPAVDMRLEPLADLAALRYLQDLGGNSTDTSEVFMRPIIALNDQAERTLVALAQGDPPPPSPSHPTDPIEREFRKAALSEFEHESFNLGLRLSDENNLRSVVNWAASVHHFATGGKQSVRSRDIAQTLARLGCIESMCLSTDPKVEAATREERLLAGKRRGQMLKEAMTGASAALAGTAPRA